MAVIKTLDILTGHVIESKYNLPTKQAVAITRDLAIDGDSTRVHWVGEMNKIDYDRSVVRLGIASRGLWGGRGRRL